MKEQLLQKLSTSLLLFLGLISSILSIKYRTKFGSLLGDAMRLLSRKRRDITLDNITSAMPNLQPVEAINIMKASYRNLGITLAEILVLNKLSRGQMDSYVRFEDLGDIKQTYAKGRGLIFLSGHYGNWEYMAYNVGQQTGIPITIIVKPQKNVYADQLMNKYRTSGGNEIISMYSAARTIVKALLEKKALALLADQSATEDKDLFVNFFGRMASTYEAPAELALKFKVPIIMGFSIRQADGTYFIRQIHVDHEDLENTKEGIEELTKRHVAVLEQMIREHPGLWAWQHRRWKHQPKSINQETTI